jgi:hypothetical protein
VSLLREVVLHRGEKHGKGENMCKWMRTMVGGALLALVAAGIISLLATIGVARPEAAETAEAAKEPSPPADQTYVGSKRCASCHFEQFMSWRKTKHSKSFDLLPPNYQADPTCVKCHSTGYGTASGFKDIKSTASLAGTTCEACHGPGSKHEQICAPLAKIKNLTPAQEKQARDSIWLVRPENACIQCHVIQAHKENPTPKALRKAN